MRIVQINDFIPTVPTNCVYNCLVILGPHTYGEIKKARRWRQYLQIESAKAINFSLRRKLSCKVSRHLGCLREKGIKNDFLQLTFSGNHGVTNGIWNVLLYEWSVSKESGETAPIIPNTPRENWLHTIRVANVVGMVTRERNVRDNISDDGRVYFVWC